ncbi:hypothetical protein [Priestia megaterium]|uniref:hypothetical protein n=1 Tax=Priestia megaterium TaxID=1404 RepID=UPI00077D7631|nr:hypothetical protein [Priestia megaterium]
MSLKERAFQEFNKNLEENETIKESIVAYYEVESGISGLVGVPNGTPTPVRGILAYSDKSLMFYGEVFRNLPITLHIPYRKIDEIKEKKHIFKLFKSSPTIVVIHKDQDMFSTRGNEEEFVKLHSFFENVKHNLAC